MWDALDGSIRDAEAFVQKEKQTELPLTLEPYGSRLIVFHRPISESKQGSKTINDPNYDILQTLGGSWNVNFDPKWGGPKSIIFPELMDWTQHTDKGVKFYSGTAIYHKQFTTNFKQDPSRRYFLQLENVKDVGIASIHINGKDKGIVWTKPFRVEITDALKDGKNDLAIEVTNSWYNRVAGDEMGASSKKYTRTNIVLGNDFRGHPLSKIPLESSGLLGPVTLQVAVEQ